MDGVLVHQTGRDGFDRMPWMPDGRDLWEAIKGFSPTILSQLPDEIWARCAPQKLAWCARELGADVPVLVVKRSVGKSGYAAPGSILIDDGAHTHGTAWIGKGGIFIHHRSASWSITELRQVLKTIP